MTAADISAALDGRKLEVLRYLLPAGNKVGHEYVAGDLSGQPGRSLKISLNGKGTCWSDFATGEAGGDLLDLWAAVRCGRDLGEAMREAADWLGLDTGSGRSTGPGDRPPAEHPQLGQPNHLAEYNDPAGRTLGFVYRWNARPGRRKEIRPLTRRDGRWCWRGFDDPRPLYRLADLAAHPERPVLVVEGELKADVAADMLADYCITTWPSGAKAVGKADLAPLRGRRIVCWPDADRPGREAMQQLTRLALAAGAAEARVVELAPDLPDGWDLADPLPEGWTTETVERLIREAPMVGKADAPAADDGVGEWDAGDDADRPISPRGWLLGNIFCRGFLSSLLGDGGVGKTALRIAQLLSLATGRSLTGDHVFRRCRVLIVSAEDDADELRRRVRAAVLHHRVTYAELRGWLYLAAIGSTGWKLAVLEDDRVVASELVTRLAATITRHKIDVISLDPFKKTHGVEENDNTAVDQVAQLLTSLATEYGIAVDAPHHVSKGPADAGNANRGRGASAFKDAARLVYTLTPMTPEEAEGFGVPERERRLLIRMDSAKVNIAPPAAEAKWFRLVGVPLCNADTTYPRGDEVQTVETWDPPDAWKGLGSAILNDILSRIDAGMPDGDRYSHGTAAGDRAAWKVVVELAPDRTEKQARQIISTWLKNGLLYPEEYTSPTQRKTRKGLRVNHAKRPT